MISPPSQQKPAWLSRSEVVTAYAIVEEEFLKKFVDKDTSTKRKKIEDKIIDGFLLDKKTKLKKATLRVAQKLVRKDDGTQDQKVS